jgi:hypothetical protein
LVFCGQSSCNASYDTGNCIHTSITKEAGIKITTTIIIMIIVMMTSNYDNDGDEDVIHV